MTFEDVSLDVLEVPLHGEDELKDLWTVRILLDHGLELPREAFKPTDRILCFLSIVLAHTVVVVVGRGTLFLSHEISQYTPHASTMIFPVISL